MTIKAGDRIYMAGPYTNGDVAVNVARVIFEATILLDAGLNPFVPHLFHFWHLLSPRPYETWLELDLAFLPTCKAMVRLPGESPGADREMLEASRLGLPIFTSAERLLLHYNGSSAK